MDFTKYEKARLIGARAFELFFGAPPLVKISDENTPDCIQLAKKELEKKVIPLVVATESKSE